MDDADPTSSRTDSSTPFAPNQPFRRRYATRFMAAPSLALTALAAVPLTTAVRVAGHFGDPQTAAVLADRCHSAFSSGALHAMKWPDCAGD
jgi:hypothetical protein